MANQTRIATRQQPRHVLEPMSSRFTLVVKIAVAVFLVISLTSERQLIFSNKRSEENPQFIRKLNDGQTVSSVATPQLHPFAIQGYPIGGPVIATLVPNHPKDVDDLIHALNSLDNVRGGDPKFPTPVLIFSEGDLTEKQRNSLIQSTPRPVKFPIVDFTSFPPGFDPKKEKPKIVVKGRKKWGYHQAVRFWVTGIWKHPALEPYETVMRMDSDSCFVEQNDQLPGFKSDLAVYQSQYIGTEPKRETIEGMYNFTVDWMKSVGKSPGNPMMWQYVKTTWETQKTLPRFRTNLEVVRKSFVQKNDVKRWLEVLTEKEPFFVLRHGWGDSSLRFLMAAIFASNEMIDTSRLKGYGHKDRCNPQVYNERFYPNRFKDKK